jgi:hypothetical protein
MNHLALSHRPLKEEREREGESDRERVKGGGRYEAKSIVSPRTNAKHGRWRIDRALGPQGAEPQNAKPQGTE